MHPARKQRLIIVAIIVIGASAAAALIANALKQNLNLFYEPTRIVNGEAPIGRKIRVGGMVLENSLTRVPDSLTVQFVVTDY
jgi:cytochrome c-type biogenesis protein CcmE